MSERFTIRPATTADLGTIADSLVAGLSTYRGWTPIGWNPPLRTEMLIGLLQRFPHDGSWAHIASEGQEPAGHISLRPDRDEADEQRPTSRCSRSSSCASSTGAAALPRSSTRLPRRT